MRTCFTLLMWLSVMLFAHGQGPRMTARGTGKPLRVEEAAVSVRLIGGAARTEIELLFRNDSRRMLEGEFVLPLPAGATVSSYALEVNGALREAVAVEKERARNAYESIKRQMIDPGIVERESGNVYRTRVFPIPARGTKRLRIGYVETLPVEAGAFVYKLPLKFDGLLAKFRCEIEGAGDSGLKLVGAAPLSFAKDAADGRRTCERESVLLDGWLELRTPLDSGPAMVVEGEEDPVFLVSDVFPDIPEAERPLARSVRLFWDASESAAGVDPAATFALLDAWFARQGEVKVELRLVRDQVEDAGTHEVRGGDWSPIRKLLEAVDHEGATSFEGMRCLGDPPDVAIYCGDGVATLGRNSGPFECPLLVLKRGPGEVAGSLLKEVESSGGVAVKVDGLDLEQAMKQLVTLPFRVVEVSGGGVEEFQVGAGPIRPGSVLSITGNLSSGSSGEIEIAYGVGTGARVRRTVRGSRVAADSGIVRRLWAQRKLAELERRPVENAAKIIAHCREHRLVSDETSLIVLERFEDHVRYRIPPPEPELVARYEAALARSRDAPGRMLADSWRRRQAWHARSFPGWDHVLVPRLRQVAVWKKSVENVFDPGELDAAAFGVVAGWYDKALAVIERRSELADAAEFRAWREEVETLEGEGKLLAATPVQAPPPGKPLVVSIRGLVNEPGQLRVEGPLTLRGAIDKAGGSLFGAYLDHVALYRSSGKTVYNTLSKQYRDIELRPGDMVVVDEGHDSDGFDPFSAVAPSEPEDRGPIVRDADVWVSEDPIAGDSEGGGGQESRAVAGAIQIVDPAEAGMPDLVAFEEKLAAGADPWAAYLEIKAGQLRPTRFYIETARRLVAAGHDALAVRVLSTLVERGNGSGAALRAMAFWLMEFGKMEEADRVLAEISTEPGGCPASYARAELAGPDLERIARLKAALKPVWSGSEIVLADLTRLESQNPAGSLPADIRITVIGQFPDAEPDVEIVEPTGAIVSGWKISPTGGRLTKAEGLAEYMVRRAVPGTYRVKLSSKLDTSFRIAIHTDWGRDSRKTVRMTRLVEAGGTEMVAELEFEFAAE